MSVQLEDGFTRLANQILEKVYKSKFNGTQYSIVLFVLRNTYGFQKKHRDMSLTFIASGIETHKDQVKRELDKLIEWGVIKVYQDASFSKSRVIGFNKDFDAWNNQNSEKSLQSASSSTGGENVEKQSANQSTPTVDELAHQLKKGFKEIKETLIAHFEELWMIYPKKVGKEKAKEHWIKKIIPLIEKGDITFGDIMKGTRAYIDYCKKAERFYKDGSAFVNQKTWNDFLDGSPEVETKSTFKQTGKKLIEIETVTTSKEESEHLAEMARRQAAHNLSRVNNN